MGVVQIVAGVLNFLLLIYVFILLGRLVLEWIPVFNREWRPRGFGLVLAELVYTITDPPIRLFRRFIPPLRVGAVAIDFGFALTMLVCFILLSVTRAIAAG
ncbi:YggT family protein [Microbacterium xanthum]|uniref:YggT family protein n=1 Tax=Microbacterium xanthum TaxID=3079794 RepID=UPI002AD56FD5|nr:MULTISPECIES: YggT family protein [unclassified Microbacterium]MDZ8172527.1 YggT family protein [Microbacterium sp. KSW-48]MDZ8202636.1 YggT family protein [Microbacterium sp. SSW1-59]